MGKDSKAKKKAKRADQDQQGTGDGAVVSKAEEAAAKVRARVKSAKKLAKARKAERAAAEAALAASSTVEDIAKQLGIPAAPPPPFEDLGSQLRVERGFVLADLDPRSTPGYSGDKRSAELDLEAGRAELSDLQERLFANGKDGEGPSVLLIVQGMDTSGKGGIMRHVVGATDPGGVRYTAFKVPTAEERAHDFLWRIERALPDPGQLGVFDRSQYEDVLVVRVHDLVPQAEWSKRYAQINAFERAAARRGIVVVKVLLQISSDEQKARLGERLDRPDKFYKFNPGDIDERARWSDYQEAYQAVLDKTSTKGAPWYVVPADRKWYARLAVQQLLLEHLRDLDLQWPEATFDVEVEEERLAET